jgi:hypothetical protein
MRKRLIQIYKLVEKEKQLLGFVGITYKNWKLNNVVIVKHKIGSIFSANYHKEYLIVKITFKDKWQFLAELLNDGN